MTLCSWLGRKHQWWSLAAVGALIVADDKCNVAFGAGLATNRRVTIRCLRVPATIPTGAARRGTSASRQSPDGSNRPIQLCRSGCPAAASARSCTRSHRPEILSPNEPAEEQSRQSSPYSRQSPKMLQRIARSLSRERAGPQLSQKSMPPPGIAGAGVSFFGFSATIASVVTRRPATEAASWSAVRTTLAGSMTPWL